MGSPCELRLYEQSGVAADTVFNAVLRELVRLERKYTRFREDSLTSQINRSAGDPQGVEVDAETASLLDFAAIAFEQSEERFDMTSGILRRVWDFKSGRVPSRRKIKKLLPRIGWDKVVWKRPRFALPVEGMELDFGGYVKEYAADRVAGLCRRMGMRHGLVDLGGDLAVVGPHVNGRPWKVGIRNPRDPERAIGSLSLMGGAVATSGDYERFMVVDGKRYTHLMDPRTGWPIEGLASVSVAAEHCLVAGTASTIAMLKGHEAGAWLDELGLPNLRVDAHGKLSGTLAGEKALAR